MDRRQFLLGAAALAAAPTARLGGTPLALVTADLEASVVAVDLAGGRIHRRLATLPDPRSIESVGGTGAVVAHTAAGRLSLIDDRLRVHAVEGRLGAPRYTAVSPRRTHAYVTDSARGELAVLDLRRRRVVGRVRVGGSPRHLTLDPRGRRLWVVLGNASEEIAIVGLDAPGGPRVLGRVRAPFPAHDVGYEPGGARVWVTSGDRGRLAVYDDHGARLVRTLRGDAPPQHVTFLGGLAFVSSGDDAVVRVHRLDGTLLRSTPVPAGSYNVQEGWGVVLTPSLSQGTLCWLSGSGATLRRLRVARSSHDACFVKAA